MKLNAGVLIIGSLLWQDYLDKPDNTKRKDWRKKHLLLSKKIQVHTPIRYGRKSDSNIYTMTFSNSCRKKNLGKGFFVPFKHNTFKTFPEIFAELKELSVAEGMKGKLIAGNSTAWCILGLRFNDNKIDKTTKRKILKWYKEQLKKEISFDNKEFKIGSETPCIKSNGVLNIPWITATKNEQASNLNDYDFLVATATLPTKYPSVNELYENVKADTSRKYFIGNNKSGIETFQDKSVMEKLKSK